MTTAQSLRPLAFICLTVSLSGRPADAGEMVVDWDFATALDLEGWTIAKPLNATIVSGQGRDGALSLDGSVGPKDSSYFMCSDYFALQPRQHYRLHARLKVVRYDAPGYQRPSWGTCAGDVVPPMLVSVALCDASRKQLVPPARSYDMDELGTWQDLRIDFLTTTDMRAGRLRLNKQMAPSVSMEMLIDHLKVQHVKPVPRPTFISETPEQLTRDGVAHRTVPLRVLGWPEGVTRPWPVSSGIPLPAGELVDPSHVRLADAAGRSVPCQTEAVSRWQDGSVRWLLVDVQVDAPKTFSLHYGREVNTPPRTALQIEDSPGRIHIDTGALEVSIKRQGFDLLERVVRDGRELLRPGEDRFTLVTADGVVHRASRDLESEVSVLRRGPLHVALEARGWLVPNQGKRRFAYETRLDVYAGMDLLGLAVTFINKSDADREPIQSVSVNLPLAQQPKQWSLCGTMGQGPGWLLQDTDDHFATSQGTEGTQSVGWAVAGPCGVAVRHWWQNHAKGFEVGPGGLRIELWPRRHAEPYACLQGTAKTHEMVLRFAPKVDDAAELSALMHAMPQLAAPPEWNCTSKVCGDMITVQESAWPWFDEQYARAIDGYEDAREKHRFYGVRDFGDWARAPDPVLRPKEKGLYFDNNSRGMDISLYQQYLRTGNIRYLRVARQITLHQMDIDTIHHHPTRPDFIGATHSQCVNNWHVTNPPNPVYSYYGGELLLSALTGDPRAYRTAKGTADWHVTQAGVGSFAYSPGYGYERACGWSLAGYMDMYEASWERKYLEAAERIVGCVFVRATREHGGAPVPVGNHMSRYGGCSWMAGCLCYGLVRYHTRTDDPRAASALTTIADWLVDVL